MLASPDPAQRAEAAAHDLPRPRFRRAARFDGGRSAKETDSTAKTAISQARAASSR